MRNISWNSNANFSNYFVFLSCLILLNYKRLKVFQYLIFWIYNFSLFGSTVLYIIYFLGIELPTTHNSVVHLFVNSMRRKNLFTGIIHYNIIPYVFLIWFNFSKHMFVMRNRVKFTFIYNNHIINIIFQLLLPLWGWVISCYRPNPSNIPIT